MPDCSLLLLLFIRSLGALRAPTSSWRPFGPFWLCPSSRITLGSLWSKCISRVFLVILILAVIIHVLRLNMFLPQICFLELELEFTQLKTTKWATASSRREEQSQEATRLHKGLFTYYVSQIWTFLDPPPPPRQQSSSFGLPPLPPSSSFVSICSTPPQYTYGLWQTLFDMIWWGIFICFGPVYITYDLA